MDFIIDFFINYSYTMIYLSIFGAFATLVNLILAKGLGSVIKNIFLAPFVLMGGGFICAFVYALCDWVLSIPMVLEIAISIVCAYYYLDVIKILKNALNTKIPTFNQNKPTLYGLFPFADEITCKISNDGKTYTLQTPIYYYFNQKEYVIIPKGFVSDGYSNALSFLTPQYGAGLKCAILHDFLYERAKEGKITYAQADKFFLNAMLEFKIFNKPKIYAIYILTRLSAKVQRLDKDLHAKND